MKKRWLLLVPAIAIVVLVALFLYLRSAYPPERLVALVEPRVEAALGRDVQIGSAQLTPFPLAVRLDGVRIAAAPGFASPDLVVVNSLGLDLRLGALLRRQIAVRSLVVDSPRVILEQNAEGRWNYEASSDTVSKSPGAPRAPGGAAPLAIAVETLSLRDGRLEVWSAARDLGVHVPFSGKLSLQVDRALRDVRAQGWFESAGLSGGERGRLARVRDLHLRLEPRLRVDVADSSAVIEALGVELQGLAIEMAGRAALQDGRPELRLQTRSNEFELADLLRLVPPDVMPDIESVNATGRARLTLEVDLPVQGDPILTGRVSVTNGTLDRPAWPPIRDLNLDLDWAGDFLMLTKCEAKVAGSAVRIDGRVHKPLDHDHAALDVNVRAAADLESLSRVLEPPAGVGLAGTVGASLRVQGNPFAQTLPDVYGPITLDDVRVHTPALALPLGVQGKLEAAGDVVRIATLTLQAGDARMAVEGTLHPARAPELPRVELRGRAGRLDLDPLLPPAEAQASPAAAGDAPESDTRVPLLPARVQATLQADEVRARGAVLRNARLEARGGPDDIEVVLHADEYDRDKLHLEALQGQVRGKPDDARGTVTARSGKLDRLVVTELRSRVALERSRIELTDLEARAYQGRVSGNLSVDLSAPTTPRQAMQLQVEEVELGGLLADVVPSGSLVRGDLSGTSSWTSSGTDGAAVRRNLSAEGKGVALQGNLRNWPLLVALGELLKLESLNNFNYRDIGFEFQVQSGRIRVPRLQVRGNDATLALLGGIGLDGVLDLELNVQLSQALSRQYLQQRSGSTLGSLLADEQGHLVLDFDVVGSVKSPRLHPNLQRTASRAGLKSIRELDLRDLLGEVARDPKEAGGTLGKRLEDAVGGLLGQKKRAEPDSTRKP